MNTLILAAGHGTRLGRYATNRPKCLVDLGGRTLLERSLRILTSTPGLIPTVVASTSGEEQVRWYAERVVVNPEPLNIVDGILCGMEVLAWPDRALVVYGDIVYEPAVITAALTPVDAAVVLPINTGWRKLWQQRMSDPLADAETLILSPDGSRVTAIGDRPDGYDQVHGQFMGVFQLQPAAVEWIRAQPWQQLVRLDTTSMLATMIADGLVIAPVPVDGGWLEIDTESDLELYRRLHEAGTLDTLCRLERDR